MLHPFHGWRFCMAGCILLALAWTTPVMGAEKIVKVLPHYLDLKGRHTLFPSLYERDAYQAELRKKPGEQSGIRFDVQWKGPGADSLEGTNVILRVEMMGVRGSDATRHVMETAAFKKGWGSTWTALTLSGEPYKAFGQLSAWRVSLVRDGQKVSHQQSFLWPE